MIVPFATDHTDVTYDASVFASILSLEDAHNSVQSSLCFEKFLLEFVAIATKHSLNDLFGLNLVHRHASLISGERMLDFKQTLQPFPLADYAQSLHGCPGWSIT